MPINEDGLNSASSAPSTQSQTNLSFQTFYKYIIVTLGATIGYATLGVAIFYIVIPLLKRSSSTDTTELFIDEETNRPNTPPVPVASSNISRDSNVTIKAYDINPMTRPMQE